MGIIGRSYPSQAWRVYRVWLYLQRQRYTDMVRLTAVVDACTLIRMAGGF